MRKGVFAAYVNGIMPYGEPDRGSRQDIFPAVMMKNVSFEAETALDANSIYGIFIFTY